MCLFCSIAGGETPAHVVFEDDRCLAFLDHRPLFEGHSLLIPRAHHSTLGDLPEPEVGPLFGVARLIARSMESALGCDGTFVAVNNRVSQSVPHLHVHIVPRRRKDGLRGFFWPRHRYESDHEMSAVAARLRTEIDLARAAPNGGS